MGSIISGLTSPLRNLRNIRNLSTLKDEDVSTFWAIRDINFEVYQGEVLGIIGNNGAGKSTLLKILSQITEPSEGEVIIRGRVSSLLEVGTGFHPELTGRENVYMNGTILGMTKKEIDQKFDEIVEFSGVQKHIDTPVKFYSSGMKVRLGFAVAAHLEPDILIIDEVLAVGDAEFQKKCLGKMEDVAKQGRTVLFVSHNMLAVKSLCTTGILISQGVIIQSGTAQDIVDFYQNLTSPKGEIIFDKNEDRYSNEFVLLKKVSLISGNDGTFKINERFTIHLLFLNLGNALNGHVNIFFNSVDSTPIFVALSDSINIDKGEFEVTCEISPDLLNDIYYSIDVMVVSGGVKPIFHARNVMLIQGIEPPRNGAWLGKMPGFVRPKLNWTYNSSMTNKGL